MKNNPKKVLGIYIRVSDPKQVAKGISLHDQEIRGIRQANELGWDYEIFKDAGLSGTLAAKDRPKLNELIERILADEIQGMYYVEIDRMSRNVTDGNILLTILIDKKIRLFDYTGEVNIQDESVEDMQRIKLIFSGSVARGIRRKVKRTLDTNVEEGRVTGGMLKYGYKKGNNKMMLIDEEEAKVVKMIFELSYNGMGVDRISTRLNELKIPTKRTTNKKKIVLYGKTFTDFIWTKSTILGILRDSIYKGERWYSKWKKGTPKMYEAPQLEIIPKEFFDATQIKLKTRKVFSKTSDKYAYLLKGLIICEKCGEKYYGVHNKGYRTYLCRSRQHNATCGNRGVNVPFFDKFICDTVNDLVNMVEEVFKDKNFQERNTELSNNDAQRKRKIKELAVQKDRLFELYLNPKIKQSDIDTKIYGIDNELDALLKLDKSISKGLSIIQEKDRILEIAAEGIKQFKKMKVVEDKQKFLRDTISGINIRWVSEEDEPEKVPHFDIKVNFIINHLETYLVCKTISFDRTRKGATKNKYQTNILSDKVTLSNLSFTDEDINVEGSVIEINYTKHLQEHTLDILLIKQRKEKK